jgi:1-acyl-sn-glycerol-3-phosphate acyltransferase
MLVRVVRVVCAVSDKNLFEKQGPEAISAAEIDATIEKARAVSEIGALGSSWVYRLIKRYFSPTVVGLENIPEQPTLFVGNHCLLGLDGFVVGPVLYYEANRFVRMMGDNIWLQSEMIGDALINSGMIPGDPRACSAMMQDGHDLLVFPGGSHESLKPESQKYTLQWRERYGFVRMAARHGYSITPFGHVGPDDFYEHRIESEDFLESRLGKLLKRAGVITDEWREDLLPVIPSGLFATLLPKPQPCYLAFGESIQVPEYRGDKIVPGSVLKKVRKETADSINGLIGDMLLLRTQQQEHTGLLRRFLTL